MQYIIMQRCVRIFFQCNTYDLLSFYSTILLRPQQKFMISVSAPRLIWTSMLHNLLGLGTGTTEVGGQSL